MTLPSPRPWTVKPTGPAVRDLERLEPAVAAAVVEFIAGPLADNPYRLGAELRNQLAGHRSARRGDYRVIYRLNEAEHAIEIIHISHRRTAYRPGR